MPAHTKKLLPTADTLPNITDSTCSMIIQVRPSSVRPLPNTFGIPSTAKAKTSLFHSLSSTFLASLSFPTSLLVQ